MLSGDLGKSCELKAVTEAAKGRCYIRHA